MEIFGIPLQAFLGQLMLGLVNGAFYAMLSLGLAVIFGLLDIVNFAHGALYMLGAFAAWIMLDQWGVNYWFALVLAPLVVGTLGVVIERTFLKRLYGLDPLYGLLLTFGLSLILEGVFRYQYGASVEDAVQKLQYDLYYVKNNGLFLDMLILIDTLQVVLLGKGAR